MMKVSLILEAVNRATGPIRAVVGAVEKLGGAFSATAAKVTAAAGKIAGGARRAAGSLRAMGVAALETTRNIQKMVGPEGIARAGRGVEMLRGQLSGLTTGLSILKYATVGAFIGLGEEFVRGVYTAGGESQRMLVTLTRLEGSALRARQAMAWMQTFAIGPGSAFAMPDIMRSYQMAKNFGMNPQGGSLAAFADLAAGERVPLKQVLIAVKDAMEGTSTRPIANLGIKMRQGKGATGQNSYLYSNLAGKFVTEHSKKTPEATLAALVRIITAKYSGLAMQQAKTVPGGFEQIKKLLYLFQMKVADAGVIDWTLKQMNRFFAWVRQASASGTLDRLAKQIAAFITGGGDRLIAFLRATDWAAVGRDLKLLAQALVMVAGAVMLIAKLGGGGLHGLFNLWLISKVLGLVRAFYLLWPVIREIGSALRILGPALLWVGRGLVALVIGMGPIGWIAIGVAALAAAAYLLWRNWSQVTRWLKALTPTLVTTFGPFLSLPLLIVTSWRPLTGFFQRLWRSISAWRPPAWMQFLARLTPIGGIARVVNGVAGSSWAQMVTGAGARPEPARATARPLLGRDPFAGTRTTTTANSMTIEFRNAPPIKSTRLNPAPNWDLSVKRGPIRVGD